MKLLTRSGFRNSASPCRWHTFVGSALPRGLALFFGTFALINLFGDLRASGFDANLWWIDLRLLPPVVARGFLLVAGVCLVSFGLRPACSRWRRWLTVASASALGLVMLFNSTQFYLLLARGAFGAGVPLPLSILLAAGMALIAQTAAQTRSSPPRLGFFPPLAVCLGCALLFPLGQMLCFGKTDYRRPADVAVVLGARVYRDGRPSDALADRVRTACRLYRDGWVHKLIFSGGPGDGAITEPESMKRLAIRLGVNSEDILIDSAGLNTQATVRNSEALCAALHASRVLVVSHFYHLPRIKLAYQRTGYEVYTVPAKESYLLGQLPYNMAREVAALWVYYARPLLRPV